MRYFQGYFFQDFPGP